MKPFSYAHKELYFVRNVSVSMGKYVSWGIIYNSSFRANLLCLVMHIRQCYSVN